MNKAVILDTNLTVLLIVGLVEIEQVGVHKRTRAYDREDFTILSNILSRSSRLIFTPNVVTETSNLLGRSSERYGAQLSRSLAEVVGASRSMELLISSQAGFSRDEYKRLGLTDAVLLHAATGNGDAIILTDDLDLYLAAAHDGLEVVNFTHIRRDRRDF
ncbi:hypothetical protein NE852_23500 [Rhizobium sp. Pop5]|uniref:hypothetical protein n=1 Tax=Rhizobium sp. Pop5 TaxID=1223565 RepID=UPI0002837313|nr:hypothetical protein [Rhizobium sp. Pop5]EJZ22137.1 hypothetical protein RCCGEPOP_06341 [Rhizobium sp. Pop5]UVD56973.1 hypothetical protein NE852_23500 [Rhizobium sp. Pop5]